MIKNSYIKLSCDKNITLAVFSDIHYCGKYAQKRLESIYMNLVQHQPNYICIVGDLLDQGNVLEKQLCKEKFISWLQKLSTIAPIIIAIGNHDVTVKQHYYSPKKFVEILSTIPNVYVLDNQAVKFDSICFLGYTPPYTYYGQKPYECAQKYVNDIDQHLKKFVNESKYTVLLCHSPIYVTNSEVRKTTVLGSTNLVLSGHMHNGILPISIPGNYGIISPCKKLFPKYARGCFKLEKTTYVVSGGIITFSDVSPKILHPFNFLFPIHIEYITL